MFSKKTLSPTTLSSPPTECSLRSPAKALAPACHVSVTDLAHTTCLLQHFPPAPFLPQPDTSPMQEGVWLVQSWAKVSSSWPQLLQPPQPPPPPPPPQPKQSHALEFWRTMPHETGGCGTKHGKPGCARSPTRGCEDGFGWGWSWCDCWDNRDCCCCCEWGCGCECCESCSCCCCCCWEMLKKFCMQSGISAERRNVVVLLLFELQHSSVTTLLMLLFL